MPDNESLFFQATTAAALFGSGCCCCFGRCEIFFFPILRRLRTSSFSAPPSRTNQHKRAHKTSCVFLFIPISSRSKSTHNNSADLFLRVSALLRSLPDYSDNEPRKLRGGIFYGFKFPTWPKNKTGYRFSVFGFDSEK